MNEKKLPEGERETVVDRDKLYCAMLNLACMDLDLNRGRMPEKFAACNYCRIHEEKGCAFERRATTRAENINAISGLVGVIDIPFNNIEGYPVHCEQWGNH